MSVETTANRISYAGNGSTTVFAFPYRFIAGADLVVIERTNSTGAEVVKTITTHYTVADNGNVTMLVAPATGKTLIIYNDPTKTQGVDLRENDSLPAEEVEEALDRVTLIGQRLGDRVDRSVRLSDGFSPTFDPTLPSDLDDAAGRMPLVNEDGDGWAPAADWPDVDGVTAGMEAAQAAAEAARDAAVTAKNAAETAETNAETAETNAETAEANAETAQAAAEASATAAAASAASAAGAVAAHEADTTNIHGITDTANLLTTDNAKAVTNKDIDGGTASNTNRITLPKNTKANLDALTRKEGTVVYASDEDKVYFDDGSNLRQVGSGAGGGEINHVDNPDAESGTTGWATFADAAGTRPVDGTGGSPNVTWTRTTSSPLRDTGSFLFTKDAANRQGQGASYDFTIDAADKAKVLELSFDYKVASGTFAAGSQSSDGDLIAYIYDVTNGVLIEPSTFKLYSSDANTPSRFSGYFQSASNSTSYRLILFCASTSASAYTVQFDNIRVGPSKYVYGTPITDWVSWTPTGSWSANVTYTGLWRRVGDCMEVRARIACSGAPTNAALSLNLPTGYSIDTAKLLMSTNYRDVFGECTADDTGSQAYPGAIRYGSTTLVRAVLFGASGSVALDQDFSSTIPFTFGSGDGVQFKFSVPILGWGASTQMSNDADTRVVALVGSISSVTVYNTTPTLTLTVANDTHGGYSGSTYTIPVAGYYDIMGYLRSGSATWVAGNAIEVYISINGGVNTIIGRANTPAYTGVGQAAVAYGQYFAAGTTIVFKAYADQSSSSAFQIMVTRRAGPSAIAPNEIIAAEYTTTAGQALTTAAGNQIIDFATKTFDTHGAVTTGASWKFTAPVRGYYELRATLTFASASLTAGWSAGTYIFKNGNQFRFIGFWDVDATRSQAKYISTATVLVELNAGDYIDLRQNVPTNTTLDTSAGFNWIAIRRVGF